ncbi:glycosyltransferase family 2 protein [Actinokineospora bangkokensis]|uniref:Glycosyltransferase n=1 Tax=Actinokineospora bangkokensis TaxID=1193682 RepID=A0A1Q9LU64_9PSEU|nr:glycosyltransferase family 2 protein [Actinokineospora bangkokensis]OLR95568.1 glycosyltransferase [Actinokineospora bangkokensis]
MTEVSVLVPAKDEEATLAALADEVAAALAGVDYELILVDDGSTDGSWKVMSALAEERPAVRAVRLRRNFGKAAALAAAVAEARGRRVVTMDADLQDDPAEVPRMLAELDTGADLVSGHKVDRKDPLSKRLPSKVFNKVAGVITGLPLKDQNCGLKAADAEVYRRVPLYGELHRYIPALAHNQGYKVVELAVNHRPREHGRSKYGFERYLRGAIDLLTVMTITKYGRRPAHLFSGVGALFGALGFAILLYLTGVWVFTAEAIGTRPLLNLGILLVILGVQMVSFGLIAEMLLHRTARRDEVAEMVVERTGDEP